jgi:hypothetical protein
VSPVKYELGFYIPEDDILHSHRRENLRSYRVIPELPFSSLRCCPYNFCSFARTPSAFRIFLAVPRDEWTDLLLVFSELLFLLFFLPNIIPSIFSFPTFSCYGMFPKGCILWFRKHRDYILVSRPHLEYPHQMPFRFSILFSGGDIILSRLLY